MRRADRQLDENEIQRILQDNTYGVLSTIGTDGFPYGIPLTYIYEDERIYFHSAPEGHKLDNIDYCNKTSFCVIGNTELLPEQSSTKYECVIAFGDIQELVAAQKKKFLQK